jgi:hypothetical protein
MEPNLKNAGRSPATTPDILRLEAMLGDMPLAPGERFYAKMRRAPWAQVPRPDAACARRHASRRLAFGVAAALATVALVAATPQGRALAQTVVQFFTRLQTDTREISSEAAPQPLPYQEECGSVIHPRCSVAEIRERVGFSVVELGTPPEGMFFEGATGGPERAMLVYRGERGSIILVQSPAGLDDAGVWAVSAGANVETVTIGATSGSTSPASGEGKRWRTTPRWLGRTGPRRRLCDGSKAACATRSPSRRRSLETARSLAGRI